jgi:5-methylcytosine-specific restriction endonuclease McrA
MKQVYLKAAHEEREEIKSLGGKWDREGRSWYIFVEKEEDIPAEIIGRFLFRKREGKELYVDMVPSSSWFSNIRSEIKQSEWKKIATEVYKINNKTCVICGGFGRKHLVEAHERWSYKGTIQKLVGIEPLCPSCHECTHIGLASARGRMAQAISHLRMVNDWNQETAFAHVSVAYKEWEERSLVDWEVDLNYIIEEYGEYLSEGSKENCRSL